MVVRWGKDAEQATARVGVVTGIWGCQLPVQSGEVPLDFCSKLQLLESSDCSRIPALGTRTVLLVLLVQEQAKHLVPRQLLYAVLVPWVPEHPRVRGASLPQHVQPFVPWLCLLSLHA